MGTQSSCCLSAQKPKSNQEIERTKKFAGLPEGEVAFFVDSRKYKESGYDQK